MIMNINQFFMKVIISNIVYELFIKVKHKKLNNDHLYVLVMNYTLTQDLNLSYQHKSVTNKMLYKNSALGYKESNVIITL